MNAPRGLGREGRLAWRAGYAALEAATVDVKLVAPTLHRLATLADQLALAEQRWASEGRPLTTSGSKKQDVPHPLLRVMADLRRQINEHEEALGLTPRARSSMRPAGWALGHPRSPDRASRARATGKVVRLSDRVREAIGDAGAD